MPKIFMPLGDATEAMDTFYPYYRLQEDGIRSRRRRAGSPALSHRAARDSARQQRALGHHAGAAGLLHQGHAGVPRCPAAADFAGAFVSGGRAPEYIRYNQDLLRVMREIHQAGKPIACVCHGIEILTAAGIIGGRTVTTVPKCKLDAEQGGATYVDKEVVLDGNIVTSRYWMDNAHLMREFLKMLKAR